MRKGISLLEVLISMFVLTVGLLYLGTLVPVGQFQISQATHADVSAVVGNSAFREIRVRDMMDGAHWVYLHAVTPSLVFRPVLGEPLTNDADGDGHRDLADGDTFVDLNGNNTWDPPAFSVKGEVFNDVAPPPPTGNGRWNAPETFVDTNGNGQWDSPTSFVIDPLSVASNTGSPTPLQYRFFPYGDPGAGFQMANFTPNPVASGAGIPIFPKPWRVSILDLSIFESLTSGDRYTISRLGSVAADRIFRGNDDKIYELLPDPTKRPILVNSTSAVQSQSQGDYSWLAMVSPVIYFSFDTTASPGPMPVPRVRPGLTEVSVVVFHKRDLLAPGTGAVPSERFVWADVNFSGSGSMDVQLRDTVSTTREAAREVLKVRQHQWVMISGQIPYSTVPPPAPPTPPPHQRIDVHRWFRIVATGDVEPTTGGWVRDVTLTGPDLSYFDTSGAPRYRDADADSTPAAGGANTLICTICDGVVGVFHKTIQLDEPSLWTSH